MFWYLVESTVYGSLVDSPMAPTMWAALSIGVVLRCYSDERFRTRELLLVLPAIFTCVLVIYGTAFSLESTQPFNPWRERFVWGILLAQLVASGFTVWWLRGVRVPAICFLLFGLHISAIAGLEAAMSVTNRWL